MLMIVAVNMRSELCNPVGVMFLPLLIKKKNFQAFFLLFKL